MRAPDGQKIIPHQLSAPQRAKPSPTGGKFIAHGVTPSTFKPMPKPLPLSQPPVENPLPIPEPFGSSGWVVSTNRQRRIGPNALQVKKLARPGSAKPKRWSNRRTLCELAAREYEENGFPLHKNGGEGRDGKMTGAGG